MTPKGWTRAFTTYTARIATHWRAADAICSRVTGSSIWRGRSSASAASERGPGSPSCIGRDDGDPLFLQIKEAQESVLEPHLGKSKFRNSGKRVVEGQRLMQAASDIFLGWIHSPFGLDGIPRDYYVRQLWDWKTSVDMDRVLPRGLILYARICGWTLARAHARSGDRIAIASYLGKGDVFDRALADFAATYADVNERDYKRLTEAAADGRIVAELGI